MTYTPTISNNIKIAFGKKLKISTFMTRVFQDLGVNNIRVMKQCKWCLDIVDPLIRNCEAALAEEVREHVVLLTVARYESSFPLDLNDLTELSEYAFLKNAFGKELNPKEQNALSLHNKFGFTYSCYDAPIAEYLRTGVFNSAEFRNEIEKLNEKEKESQIHSKLRKLYNLYNGNFQSSAGEISNKYIEFLGRYSGFLSLSVINNLCGLLEEIGIPKNEKKHEWVDASIRKKLPNLNIHQMIEMRTHATEITLIAEIDKIINTHKEEHYTLKEIIYKISGGAWDQKDIDTLVSYSQESYEKWLCEETDMELLSCLRQFMSIFPNRKEKEFNDVCDKIKSALKIIASKSHLNRTRVEQIFGIQLDG